MSGGEDQFQVIRAPLLLLAAEIPSEASRWGAEQLAEAA